MQLHPFLQRLFPICRSLTGDGVRETLTLIKELLPELTVHEVPSGTQAFDWTVPDEWNITNGTLIDPSGNVIADFQENNLHIVGYSEPIDCTIELEDLKKHLHSRPDLPDAIPYVTSYYSRRWGFCLTDRSLKSLQPGLYHAKIESSLQPGHLTYGELIIPGSSDKEIFLSTYVCHPSMANNELSGPVVATALGKWLLSMPRKYTYRIVFIPETIGSIVYLSKNYEELQRKVIAGFNLTCLGDERAYSYLPSRDGHTLADNIARHVLHFFEPEYREYSFLDRGSDERQYCAPGIDLPVCSVMRSKYGEYPEYHTSLDDCQLVTEAGLQGGVKIMQNIIQALEKNEIYCSHILCEPQLGKRNLYPTLSTHNSATNQVQTMMDLLAYIDGKKSLLDIANIIGESIFKCDTIAKQLVDAGVITPVGTAV